MYLVINKWIITVKISNLSGHYLRNQSTLDISVLGYIGIVWPKEHSPEVWHIPPGTPCIRHHGVTSHRLLSVTPVRTSNPNWIQTDESSLSLFVPIALFLTLCFLTSFVCFCFPSLLFSHIYPFIVAEHWLGSSPSRTHPQRENFFLFYFLCPQPTSGRTSWPPTIWLQNPDLWNFAWHFYFALTNLWLRHVWLLTYTLWTLYSIGKLNLKFNQQNYVTFFNLPANEIDPPSLPDQLQETMCRKCHPGKRDG